MIANSLHGLSSRALVFECAALLLIAPLAGCDKSSLDGGIRELSRAISADPNNASAYGRRGSAHFSNGEYDSAISDYSDAIRISPDDAGYFSGRGHAFRAKGDYGRAISDYGEAIRLNPRAAIHYRSRALVHLFNKADYDSAIRDYTEAIKISPRDGPSYVGRGNAYDAKGDKAKAGEDYAKAREL
jgi:tetratricopeptide (TPR) repeat protein